MLIVIYLLYVKSSEIIHINRLLDSRNPFSLNKAEKSLQVDVPVIVRLAGNNVEAGQKILAQSGLPIIRATTLKEAAERAVGAWQNDAAHGTKLRSVS